MSYPIVNLPNSIIVQHQITKDSYEITDVTDNPVEKTVVARVVIGGNINFFTVWSGGSYDDIGQWTDTDLVNAVTPLILQMYPSV